MHKIKKGIMLGLLFLLSALQASAQVSIKGSVSDGTAPLKGCAVELKDENDSTLMSIMTNDKGVYSFRDIPEGSYVIRVSLEGFDESITQLTNIQGGAV